MSHPAILDTLFCFGYCESTARRFRCARAAEVKVLNPWAGRFAPALRAGLNLGLVALWLWLYRPVFQYFSIIFTREEFRTNQILLAAVTFLIFLRLRKARFRPQPDALPQLQPAAIALAAGGSLLYLAVEHFLDIHTLSASLFGLATYGLIGLWMKPRDWSRGFPAALLLVGILPFGDHVETFLGYPLRKATAEWVRAGLSAAGAPSPGVDTILVFESGISQIDLPCSGVKSLWTGALFFLAATWIERRRMGWRWLVGGMVFACLLVTANLVRVAALVVAGPIAGWRLLAEMIHVPLGALGFAAACTVAIVMLRRCPIQAEDDEDATARPTRPRWLPVVLAAGTAMMALAYSPRAPQAPTAAAPILRFPAEMNAVPLPLDEKETAWILQDGAESAERLRFNRDGLSGTILLLRSATWRGQHRPERCFEVYGFTVEETATILVRPGFSARTVGLGLAESIREHTAVYWLQSADQTTDDFGTRMWADLSPHRQTWVLVTVLFDQAGDPLSGNLRTLLIDIQNVVQQSLLREVQ